MSAAPLPPSRRAEAGMMACVPDMRRRAPEPPAGLPQIQFKPGMANELLQELAPLLAAGILMNRLGRSTSHHRARASAIVAPVS
jgi:hypothetical protein